MYLIKRVLPGKNVEKISCLGKHQVLFSSHIIDRNKNLGGLEFK